MSPHKRTIQTAVQILSSNPQFLSEKVTFTLFPWIKEQMCCNNDCVCSRGELEEFVREIGEEHP